MILYDKTEKLMEFIQNKRGSIILPGGKFFIFHSNLIELTEGLSNYITNKYQIVDYLLEYNLYDLLMLRLEEKFLTEL